MEERDLPLSVALLQAPVFHAYSIMLYLEFEEEVTLARVEEGLKAWPTLKFVPPSQSHSLSVISAAGQDKILVGQLKQDKTRPQIFWIWMAADNLTRCSALNAYEVARIIADEYWFDRKP
jgi:aspartate-semialdehyde dehydrogenase